MDQDQQRRMPENSTSDLPPIAQFGDREHAVVNEPHMALLDGFDEITNTDTRGALHAHQLESRTAVTAVVEVPKATLRYLFSSIFCAPWIAVGVLAREGAFCYDDGQREQHNHVVCETLLAPAEGVGFDEVTDVAKNMKGK
ncbi:hypothetical protein CYMTET_52024 [Cymbomonas tetramitiformis]|uniref:Uncharacterized protein n=1 Tax=Cymbomonas tetramitiformis TaxID=36881 RepID=A0AAE0BL07_9CHLO|nr:hypothetical protein CYMTET_52024 [Cymbomonas tetramitiformis]